MHRLIFWQFLFLKKFKNNWIYMDQRAEWWVASVVTRCVYRFYGCMAQIQVPVNILESDTAKLEYRDLEQFCFVFPILNCIKNAPNTKHHKMFLWHWFSFLLKSTGFPAFCGGVMFLFSILFLIFMFCLLVFKHGDWLAFGVPSGQ